MNELLAQLRSYITTLPADWDTNVIFITAASFVAWIAWRVLYSRLDLLVDKTKFQWDNLTLHALKAPISTLIWLWPATVSIGILIQNRFQSELNWLSTLKHLLVIAIFVWIVIRLINNVEKHVLSQKKRDETTVQAIAKVTRLIFLVIGGLTIMQSFGLSLSGLLTFGGVGGLIVGLAAKDLLANFFGGLMIYFDRPFKVGDWVRSPDRQIEGTVERIGWRMTIVRTFDKRPLYIPNSVFSNIVVENPSRMLNRRIKENIGLRYDDSKRLSDVVSGIKSMLQNHPDIDNNQTLIVNLVQFGPSSLDIMVYTFTKTVNWIRYQEVKQDVMLKILEVIHSHGADIAFPTQTIRVDPQSASAVESSIQIER
ncbi:mechanosensitive ion channel family protein [Vibrio sp. S4M6]|uniref:mechanosensitive ion channel family protein n=1 Tax=Vibrio sinus TaxID=2946865 RepID=UPI00202AC264|nr:mechanosensitive ion channel family protein [Vibrio sinus]MCL9780113.1 mechanosensitive ion channel family protein [Vibrio sinus]